MKAIHTSGKRKTAVARVTLTEGNGKVRINKKLLDNHEPKISRLKLREPLLLAGEDASKVDLCVNIKGGGTNSQAEAARLAIARALSQQPKIILADEPVSSLDPYNKKEIMNLLSSICEEHKLTLLISMHEVELVKKYVSRVVGIRDARIVFDNKPEMLNREEYARIYN